MEKLLGEKRRHYILEHLKTANTPVSGSELAKTANVSRQVIVQDISLLKAKDEPITATPQGYVYVRPETDNRIRKIIAVNHTKAETEQELTLLVDCGITVVDVTVEHPIYGEITAALHVKNRFDVDKFIQKVRTTNASLLAELTGSVHLHTIEADTEEQISKGIAALDKAGFLI